MAAPQGQVLGNPYGSGGGSSFLKRLFGAQVPPPEQDPVPGIGGYVYPPGPAGQTGYPGSTSARRTNPRTANKNTLRHTSTPWVPVQYQQENRQNTQGEFHGGLPSAGSSSATFVGPQYQDTESRSFPAVGADVPGGQNQRNTSYYGGLKAQPGIPASDGAGPNRYVWGGVNGGSESYSMQRDIPYSPKGIGAASGPLVVNSPRGVRGATLNGIRFSMPPPVMQPQRDGFGQARRHQSNRPTVFTEPAPWSANFYDTTAATGGPDSPGTAQPVQAVYVSPATQRVNNWRRGG